MNIDEHLLEMRAATSGRPLTIGDLPGRLGISRPTIVLPAARRLVADGLGGPSFVQVRDTPTLHGLLPRPAATGV